MSKDSAIAKIQQFDSQGDAGVWPHVNRKDLVAGLIDRLNNPNNIFQAGTPLCGPSSFIRQVVIDNPDAYAQAAIDLYRRGQARIGSLDIKADNELRRSAIRGGTNPADWIMIASIRDSDNWFLSPAGWLPNTAGITRPATMESWFRNAGYSQIVNITYLAAKPITSVLAAEAKRASRLFSKGYKVVLFIDSDMLDADSQDDAVSMYPDHWVALTSPISDAGIVNYQGPVSFTIYSWGRQMSVPVDSARPLSKRHFLHKYYGFIAAAP